MNEFRLSVDNVDKYYGTGTEAIHAVRKLNMHVKPGEIVALLGSSGCGKTSILRMIAGFEDISKGTIHINDLEINKLAPVRRNVAMAFEGYSLYPPLTVRENISFALKSSKLKKTEVNERVDHIIQLLEINEIAEKYPVSISGGQQQRASLGRALIRDADLHLLDEPLGQLEPQLRAVLRGRIKHFIKERGLTAILVTHDQTEANALADRIAVMEGGRLQQFDSPDLLKEKPVNIFTGTFIGEPPMNVLSANVSIQSEHVKFELTPSLSLEYSTNEFDSSVLSRIIQQEKLLLGVRPYAVHRTTEGVKARVKVNQWLGDQSHILTDFAGGSLVLVEHDRTHLQVEEEISLSIAADDLNYFDPVSGDAIAHGREVT